MDLLKQSGERTVEIGRCERLLLGEKVTYLLFCKEMNEGKERKYAVSIWRGEQRESCILNDDLFTVVSFFEKIVRGGVFPYSLCELVEDFWNQYKKI